MAKKPFEVKDFSGGITDSYIDNKLGKYKEADNLIIKVDASLESRDGSVAYNSSDAQLPSGENRVNKILEKEDDNSIIAFSDTDAAYLKSDETSWKNIELQMALEDSVHFLKEFNAHCVKTIHDNADPVNYVVFSAYTTTLASLITLVSEAVDGYNAHQQDAIAGGVFYYHYSAEAIENTLVSIVHPTTFDECVSRILDLRSKFNQHKIEENAHNISTYVNKEFLSTTTESKVFSAEPEIVSFSQWKDFIYFTSENRDHPKKIYKKDKYVYVHTALSRLYLSKDGRFIDTDGFSLQPTSIYIYKVIFANNLFVAVGSNTGGTDSVIYYSSDGVLWAENTTIQSVYTDTIRDIDYSASQNLWVISGDADGAGSYGEIFYTTDPTSNWAQATCEIDTAIYSVKYISHLDKWLAVGGSNKIAYSSDAISWTVVSSVLTGATYVTGIAYDGVDTIVVVGALAGTGLYSAYSNDLATWTQGVNSDTSAVLIEGSGTYQPERTTTYGNGVFITGGLANGIIWVSRDGGVSWDEVDTTLLTQLSCIYFDDYENRFVAFSEAVTQGVATSFMAETWDKIVGDIDAGMFDVTRGLVRGDYSCNTVGLPKIDERVKLDSAGGTGNNYEYAFVRAIKYLVGDNEFIHRSAIKYESIDDVDDPSSNAITISQLAILRNDYTGSDKYLVKDIFTEIYRNVDNGTSYYFVGNVDNGLTTFLDEVSDANLILREELYTNGGDLESDPPPKCKFLHISNNVAYYANVEENGIVNTSRVRLSLRNAPDSCPEANYIDVKDIIVGINSINNIVLTFCRNSIYRLEGVFNANGSGFVTSSSISEVVGCISNNSVVRTPLGLFFAGIDGFYYTDGFKVVKISEDINETYRDFTSTAEQRNRLSGIYDKLNRAVIWVVEESGESDCNKCYVLDLKRGLSANMPFTTFSGSSFNPTSLEYLGDNTLLRGDTRGYILQHSSDYDSDVKIDTAIAASNWEKETIIYSYISQAYSFGTTFVRKFVTKILFTAKKLTDLFVQINSYNDLETSGSKVKACTEIKYDDSGELIERLRYFPSGDSHHRCSYKQIGLTNAYSLLYNSSDYTDGTVDKSAKTVTLQSGNFPTDIVGYYASFEDDSFDTQFLISEVSGDEITVVDAGGDLPSDGDYIWKIKGYAKDQKLSLNSYNIHYDYLTASQDDSIESD